MVRSQFEIYRVWLDFDLWSNEHRSLLLLRRLLLLLLLLLLPLLLLLLPLPISLLMIHVFVSANECVRTTVATVQWLQN